MKKEVICDSIANSCIERPSTYEGSFTKPNGRCSHSIPYQHIPACNNQCKFNSGDALGVGICSPRVKLEV